MKAIDAPCIHVNGEDPEAVVIATRLALSYRQTFGKDIAIDLICYRQVSLHMFFITRFLSAKTSSIANSSGATTKWMIRHSPTQ